jgi:hypothetical protein
MAALAAHGADAFGDLVSARRAAVTLDTNEPTNRSGREEEKSEDGGVEDRVDREAGPEWLKWQDPQF